MPATTATPTNLVRDWISRHDDMAPTLRRILAEEGAREFREYVSSLIIPTAPPRTPCRAWITAALRSVNWARIRREFDAPPDGAA